jgi:predicted MFS family arabinose efflux permease
MWLFAKTNSIRIPLDCKKLIFLNALFQGGRLFVGAICVLYCFSFGLPPQDYVWIKTTQALIFIILDIPLGYCLNKLGEFKSLLTSLSLGIMGSVGYLISTNLMGFLVSEVFLALSLSTWPVAFSAYSMKVLENSSEGLTEKYFHLGDAIAKLVVVVCGSVGGLLYIYNKYLPYILFFAFYVIAVFYLIKYLKNDASLKEKNEAGLSFCSSAKQFASVFPFASIILFFQFLMQPLLHYWQPFFVETFNHDSRDMSLIFLTYSLSMSAVSYGYSRISKFKFCRSDVFMIVAALFAGILLFLLKNINTFSFALLCFSFSFGLFNLVQIGVGVIIQKKFESNNRMVLTKIVSFYSRCGMIISLMTLNLLLENNWSLSEIFHLYGFIALSAFGLYLIYLTAKTKIEEKYVWS